MSKFVMPIRRKNFMPPLVALALVFLALCLGGCGSDESSGAELPEEGEPVKVGKLSITVLSSRELDRSAKADAAYLVGQPPAGRTLAFYGVFLGLRNDGDKTKLAPSMTIRDATGRSYSAFPSENPAVYRFGEPIEPGERVPRSAASEGKPVIFRLGRAAFRHQPITLHIESFRSPDVDVKLDLQRSG